MLIVYAGYSDDVGGGVVNDIWIYDINTNLWQTPGNYSAISDAQVSLFVLLFVLLFSFSFVSIRFDMFECGVAALSDLFDS